MSEVAIKSGQNILDIAISEFGSIAPLLELCEDNNINIPAIVSVDTILKIDRKWIKNVRIVDYLKNKTIASQ